MGFGRPAAAALLALGLAASAAAEDGAKVRWIAFGGGSVPESNQISLEQDLALARSVLGPGGRVLFAGGPDTRAVQVLDPAPRGDALLRRLGALFAPRGGRDAHYVRTTLAPDGAADRGAVLGAVRAALEDGTEPLLVYGSAHGEQGPTRAENAVRLWGGFALTPKDLAAAHDAAPRRPLRVVLGSCFSGGFGELAFRDADPAKGAPRGERCGLFAATWDRPSSGCDPNPDRAAQQGYGLHFLAALAGHDRAGGDARAEIDLDGDGRVSLLEAHTRARIASRSLDVPTTTSERWLREKAPRTGPRAEVALPEEAAVIRALSKRLGLDAGGARRRLAALEKQADDLGARLAAAEAAADDAWWTLGAALLTRWPVLDDPWHPDFAPTVARDRGAIARLLDSDPRAAAWTRAEARVAALQDRLDAVQLDSAQVERLVRAYETRTLAGRLKARGGADWRAYRRLLACERSAP